MVKSHINVIYHQPTGVSFTLLRRELVEAWIWETSAAVHTLQHPVGLRHCVHLQLNLDERMRQPQNLRKNKKCFGKCWHSSNFGDLAGLIRFADFRAETRKSGLQQTLLAAVPGRISGPMGFVEKWL